MIVYMIINSTVIGTVKDIKTNEVLTGVRIIVNKTDTTYTDFEGTFVVNHVDTVNTINATYPSYEGKVICEK